MNYKAALAEQVNEYCQKYGLYGDSIVDFKAGSNFAFNYQQAKIDKLVSDIENMIDESTHGDNCRHIIYQGIRNCDCHKDGFKKLLADYEKDGE